MNATPYLHLLWKEYRAIRAFWSMFAEGRKPTAPRLERRVVVWRRSCAGSGGWRGRRRP